MKNFYLILLIIVVSTRSQVAIRGLPNFFELVYGAVDIVEADWLYFENDSAVFSTTSLLKPDIKKIITITDFSDEFTIKRKEADEVPFVFLRRHNQINIEEAERLIIFLFEDPNGKVIPRLSAAYYLHKGDIYFPYHLTDSDILTILAADTLMLWDQFKANILSTRIRAEVLKDLLTKPPSAENNQLFFNWIDEHQFELTRRNCSMTQDCGWGGKGISVFYKILESGNWKDAWRASELHYQLFNSYPSVPFQLYSNTGARNFFEKIVFSPDSNVERRLAAMSFFYQSIWYPHLLNDRNDVPATLEQNIINAIRKLKGYFSDADYNYYILWLFKPLWHSKNIELNYLADVYILPFILEEYSKPRNEYLRFDMQEILNDQLSKDQLIRLSGNPKGMLADIVHFPLDTFGHRLTFQLRLASTSLNQFGNAEIVLEKLDDEKNKISFPVEIKANASYSQATIQLSKKYFRPGKWQAYAHGKPETENQFKWRSNTIVFEFK